MTQIYDEFRAMMRERLKVLGMTQEQLAHALRIAGFTGIDHTSVSRMLSGDRKRTIKLDEAITIAGILRMDLTPLVAGTGCENCKGQPPTGFVCATCGRRGGSDG